MIRIIILCIFLVACFHEKETSNDASECETPNQNIQGCWKTAECKQATGENKEPLKIWLKSEYEFTSSGQLLMRSYQFEDSSCSGSFNLTTQPIDAPTINYSIQGKITSETGIDADQVEISMSTSDDNQLKVTGGIVVTDNDELCSSESFYFGSDSFIMAEGGLAKSTGLFEDCLIRGNLP